MGLDHSGAVLPYAPGLRDGSHVLHLGHPLLDRWGTPLLFGPGSIHVAHTPDEYIEIDELRTAVDTYQRIVRTLLET